MMSEAPKRIWAIKHRAEWQWDEGGVFSTEPEDTQTPMAEYVRADIADGLLAALEAVDREYERQGFAKDSVAREYVGKAIAAARGAS